MQCGFVVEFEIHFIMKSFINAMFTTIIRYVPQLN